MNVEISDFPYQTGRDLVNVKQQFSAGEAECLYP